MRTIKAAASFAAMISTALLLTASPAHAGTPVGSCTAKQNGQTLAHGVYWVSRGGKYNFHLASKPGNKDVQIKVYRRTRGKVDLMLGDYRPVPNAGKRYTANRDRQTATRWNSAPLARVTVHRRFGSDWSCSFVLARL